MRIPPPGSQLDDLFIEIFHRFGDRGEQISSRADAAQLAIVDIQLHLHFVKMPLLLVKNVCFPLASLLNHSAEL